MSSPRARRVESVAACGAWANPLDGIGARAELKAFSCSPKRATPRHAALRGAESRAGSAREPLPWCRSRDEKGMKRARYFRLAISASFRRVYSAPSSPPAFFAIASDSFAAASAPALSPDLARIRPLR